MRRPFGLYRVAGDSMLPTFTSGQILVGRRWGKPQLGQVVVVRLEQPTLKRLIRYEAGKLWVEGDNAGASRDSRTFGAVDPYLVEATIVWPRRRLS